MPLKKYANTKNASQIHKHVTKSNKRTRCDIKRYG
jgi:hypothetical protein